MPATPTEVRFAIRSLTACSREFPMPVTLLKKRQRAHYADGYREARGSAGDGASNIHKDWPNTGPKALGRPCSFAVHVAQCFVGRDFCGFAGLLMCQKVVYQGGVEEMCDYVISHSVGAPECLFAVGFYHQLNFTVNRVRSHRHPKKDVSDWRA